MIKKKAKKKTAVKKAAKKTGPVKTKKKRETNPAEVRKQISKMVTVDATEMAKAAIADGKAGQLATVKYLFEMANIFPEPKDGSQATEEEDSLAKLLLERLKPPVKAQGEEETGETPGEIGRAEIAGELATAEARGTGAESDVEGEHKQESAGPASGG